MSMALPLIGSLIEFSDLNEEGGARDDFKRSFVKMLKFIKSQEN